MKLSELFRSLSYGHLSELAISNMGDGGIQYEKIPQVIQKINDALKSYYTRFPLSVKTVTVETVAGLHQYPLQRRFAQTSDSDEPIKFIKDHPGDPFTGNVLQVLGVSDDRYCPLPLNDNVKDCHWFLNGYDTLSYTDPDTFETFYIEYKAGHETIPLTEQLESDFEIRIPEVLKPAFLCLIAGNIYLTMSIEGALIKARELLNAYEMDCQFHEERNTFNQWSAQSERDIRRNGWV